ncbi:hypothetical protein M440DRAFT_1464490 [Trichoderma longibrachiatum ATCC 18648]|uniref:Translation initiation factor IF2/IF5 domain-containing protein n=1 Tax=Trichoderma longibrachiatum ATCC 18648 TaxID=983965 RepID=A0A2T4BYS2_TRILO|nr:hypothetical protein M440DRAFT_1464490 [Trichoderma longibrachiatum ATCC 18648]
MDSNEAQDQPERKASRKSVAFTDEQLVVETDGSITIMSAAEEPKETAQSHTPRTPPLSAALEAFANPDHSLSGTKSYKIPPPQCMREGNRKTVFANIADICKRMKRTEEHVTAYLFAELGTNGSVDGSRRLVIKGRFQQKQIENVVRKYIIEYVTCKTCKSPDTELNKGENRLYFITCNNCGSRRSVTAIKTGFSAQIGKRRKMQG